MLFHTIGQGSVFLWMLISGMLVGVLYDLFRLVRYLLHAGTALTLVLDLIWGACGGIVLAGMLVIANRGVLRAYVYLAALAGFVLYMMAASRPALALLRRGMELVQKLSRIRLLRAVFR